jgi:hypothetical protein
MYISLEVVDVWHHAILCACLRCVWTTVQADTVHLKLKFLNYFIIEVLYYLVHPLE